MPVRERPLGRFVHRCIPLGGEQFGYGEQVRSVIQRQSNRRISIKLRDLASAFSAVPILPIVSEVLNRYRALQIQILI